MGVTPMRKLLLIAGLLISNVCFASDGSVMMAEILLDLNHFPSDDDKSYLSEIAEAPGSSADEKALAGIISRIMHKPAEADSAALEAMINSKKSTPEVKILARAILSINHKPSADSIAALEGITDN
jgi:hypothetical protein